MNNKLDVVRAWVEVPAGNVEGSAAYLSDDFQNLDEHGNLVMDKDAWNGMYHMLLAAFDSYDYVLSNLREVDGYVIMTGHFEGKHTGDLDLSAMGMGVFPASGKKIVWPEESAKLMVEGGKITSLEPYGDSGGIEAFLAAIG